MWSGDNGAHAGVARVGRRGRLLTRGRAPQTGNTPLLAAALKGHLEVVQFLVQKEADTEASDKVRQGRGCWAHKRCF